MKPVRAERADRGRPPGRRRPSGRRAAADGRGRDVPVELAGVTRFVRAAQIRYAQAQGDYARLHTAAGVHLVRIPLSHAGGTLGAAGFVRIHRSTLVSLAHVREVRMDARPLHACVLDDAELREPAAHPRAARPAAARTASRPTP